MAQQDNKKLNLSSVKSGMQKDTHPSQLKESEYTHAYNANIENESGNSLNLTNEKSNILASKFIQGFRVIGFENDIDSNSTFFFLVNPSTSVGEFGVIENNQNTNDISDVLVDCDNCNKVNQLSDPLETLNQAELQTYTTLLTDADGYLDVNTNLCIPFTPGSGFNFDINYPIKKIVIKNEKCGKNIYFSDNNNPPRHINITELLAGKYNDQNIPCDDNVTTTCINYDELRIFKLFNIPKIKPATIELGGRLQMGMYEFLIAYSDASGNEISPYYSITNPIAIFDKNNRILEQKDLASRTNLAIRLEVSDLDKKYSHYKVAVIQTADIEGASRYFIEGIHTINDNTVVYSTEQNKVTTSFEKLLIDQLNIEKVEGLTASNNILFQYGITQKKEINLQPVMNLLGQFMQWQTHIAPESLYENGVLSSKFLGYNRDEVVPLSIRFLLDGGYETSLFPLISRLPLPTDKEEMIQENGDGINDDVESIIKNIQSCTSVNRNQKWQFYNTAYAAEDPVCESSRIQTVKVTEELTKTCIIEGVAELSGTDKVLVINLDNEDYVNLEQYIEDNKINCPYEFEDTGICEILSANYSANICETDVFAKLECEDISEEADLIVGEITNEKTEKIEKQFPSDYVNIKAPKNCSVHKTTTTSEGATTPIQDPDNPLGYKVTPDNNVPREVYLRDSEFENENCSYPIDIITYTNSGDNLSTPNFNNYYTDTTLSNLFTSKIAYVSSVPDKFYTNIHKGALWFAGKTENKTKFLLDISKQKITQYSDYLSAGTKVRVSIFKKCSDTTAIYSKIIDLTNGDKFLLEKDATVPTTLKITDSSGTTVPIANGWFSSTNYYIAVDVPIVSMELRTTPDATVYTTTYVVTPTDSCYTVTKRDVEFSRIEVTWDSIRFDKRIIYTKLCTFDQPVVQACNAVPFRKGHFAYWESQDEYPDNTELYDSRNLIVPVNLIPEDSRAKFKEAFVKSTANENYILGNNANFTCNKIRHFKFPDNSLAPFMSNSKQSPFGSSIIYPLGITVDENLISAFLDVAVVNGLLTQSDRNKISKYEIFRGDISLDRSVVASGLLYDMRKYKENQKKVYYPNYPFNSYQNDVLNGDEDVTTDNGAIFGVSNRNYTFHSPETDYYRQQLPSEINIQGYMFGNSRGNFDEVKGHPKWVILSGRARTLASVLAGLEVAGEILIKAAEITANAQVWFLAGFANGASIGLPAFIAGGAVTGFGVASGIIYKTAQYRYQWLKVFRDFGSPQNFAYYYYADGYYNYITNNQETGNKIRGLHIAKYLNDGRFITTNELTGERLSINNIDREKSVLLSFGDMPITYPNQSSSSTTVYKTYDKGADSSLTYQSQAGFSTKGRSPEVVRNIASPYAAIKNYLPSQYGTINSIKWLSTGYVGDLKNSTSGCLSIFGGDTYISRHTVKRKMPLFLVTAMKQADLTPFNYFFYSNIGTNPKFYCSYEQNKDFSDGGKSFPDISSDYSFDNVQASGNYVVPPSKFYLYYYGVANFLAETRINTNYRYAGKEKSRNFYPLVGDLGEWTQEETVSIREPNVFLYNSEYSKQISFTRKRTLTDTYQRSFNDCIQDMPNGIIASLPDNTENSLYDPWLIYRPLDIFEFQTNFGKLKDIIDIEGQAILARFANTSILYNKVDSKIDDGSTPIMSFLGGNSFFQRRSTSFHNTNLGYGGTQNSAFISNEFGHFFADAKRGQVLMVPTNGEGMVEISSMVGDRSSGMRNWFKEHLPFKILKYIPNVDVDNPYNGFGLTMGWDSRYRRVFLTKRDYIPKNDCIQFIEGKGFVIDQTICNDEEPIVSCPDGYTLVDGECTIETEGANLCLDGGVYDPIAQTCTYTESIPAECVCTADVIASPQTICSESLTNIVLTSTSEGIAYSWTVVQGGVTGASAGSGNTIAQTLVGSGSVTYIVTPYEISSGCQGTPKNILVTVKDKPNLVVTPTSPQNIESGDTIAISLSSNIAGTTFSWTVTPSEGVTGTNPGTGTTITDTITTTEDGTAVYHIVATAPNGCTNTLNYTVNIEAAIPACLGNFTITVSTGPDCSTHACNGGTFDLLGNNVNIGTAYLSNTNLSEDVCGDNSIYPDIPCNGTGFGNGSVRSNSFTLTTQQAQAIAAASVGGNITFALSCALDPNSSGYGGGLGVCHPQAARMRINRNGILIYDECPSGSTFTINPCTGVVTP